MSRLFRATQVMVGMALVAVTMLLPQGAQAHFSQWGGNPCTNCHTVEAGGTFYVAVNGIDETADRTVSASPGQILEIDYYFSGARGASDTTIGVLWQVPTAPTAWNVTKGTVNSPTISGPGWSSFWDGLGTLTQSTGDPSYWLYNYETAVNGFSSGKNGTSMDNGSEADLAGDRHGADFRLEVPAGASGPYTVTLIGVGHTGNGRTSKATTLTINVSGGADLTPPATVADLATGAVTSSSVALSWTAPGDDGSTGTATSYDIRYSTAGAITDANWATATQVSGEPLPSIAGTTENFTVTGLVSSTPYWFAIRTSDEIPNTSATSNSPTASTAASADVTAPATIADLAVGTVTFSSVALSWTAPGDDGAVGTANSYAIRYSTAGPITDGNWAAATLVPSPPVPSIAGTTENFTVTGLNPSTPYWFAIRTSDEVPNTSATSNSPTATTNAAPDSTPPATVSNLATGAVTASSVALSWTAPGDDNTTGTATSYDVRYSTAGTITDANWASASQATGEPAPSVAGTTENFTVTGLSPSTPYWFAVRTSDEIPNTSATSNSPTATTAAGCTINTPSFTITQANRQITAGSGTAVYNITVFNNDVGGGCSNSDITLNVVSDTDLGNFVASTTGAMPLNIAPGGSAATTLTVTAVASPANWSSNVTTLNVSAPGHTTSANQTRTTWINLPVSGSLNYNVGDTVHIEFQTTTRMSNFGTNALLINDAAGNPPVVGGSLNMVEIQTGTGWTYFYNWNTAGESANTYNIDINDVTGTRSSGIVLGSATNRMVFYSDATYTTPTDVFADLSTVYVEVLLSSAENGTDNPFGLTVENWTGTLHDVSADTGITETQTGGSNYRFNFLFDATKAGLASGDWGTVVWNEAAGPTRSLHRPIQYVSGGCSSCTQSDPSLDILTGNQTIGSVGGFVDYTIQVVNNDTVSCGPTTFTLTANDSDAGTLFVVPSTFPDLVGNQLTVGAGTSSNTTLRVSAQAGQFSGSNDTDFSTDAANGHAARNSFTNFTKRVTTTLNVPDVTAPAVSITAPVGGYLNATAADPYTVTGTASDDRGTVTSAEIRVDGGVWTPVSTSNGYADWTYSWSLPADGSHTLDARASDGTNTGNAVQRTVTVDRTAPTTSDNVVASWTSSNRNVTLTEADATSGVAATVYCVDTANACVPATPYAGVFAITQTNGQETVQYLRYASTDNAGNAQPTVSTAVNIDKKPPVDGAALTPTPGNAQIVLNWNLASDGGSGLNPTNTYKLVRADATTTAPLDCSGAAIYTGNLTSYTDSGLSNGTDYAYRVCAYDNVGWNSPGLTATAKPAAACVRATPSVSLSPSADITSDGGFVDYTITVTNNDSGGCAAQTFDVKTVTSSGAGFTVSYLGGQTTGSIGVGGNDSTLAVRVTANGGTLNGATHTVGISTNAATDPNHALDSNEAQATTTMNVPCTVAPTVSFLTANQQIAVDGGSAVYTIQVQNDNAAACGSTPFDLVAFDTDTPNGSFVDPSVFATDPLTVAPNGGTNTTTLTVTSQAGAVNGATNTSYFYTALNGTIPQSGNSPVRTTTINRPCVRNAPSFSHAVNQNIAPDGSAVYTLTILNNDVDCPDNLFTLSDPPTSETGNTTAFTLPSTLSASSVSVPAGSSGSVTLTVTANGSGAEGNALTTRVTLSSANHAAVFTDAVTTIKPFNPLIHSSLSTGSTKHSGDGGWGIANGRYGEFTCGTCHQAGSSNIKRVRPTLPSAPDTSKGDFPGAGQAISFLDASEPTTDFGDDSGAPRASSNRVCEVCHTYDATQAAGVNKHAFNQQVVTTHENNKDCTSCHKHSAGFSKAGATCDSCHGFPPKPGDGKSYQAVEGKGAHEQHVNHLTALLGITLDPNNSSYGDANVTNVCGVCHDMGGTTHEMSGGPAANRTINFNSSAAFQFGSSAPAYNGVEDVGSATTPKTCSNISCHFQATPWWE